MSREHLDQFFERQLKNVTPERKALVGSVIHEARRMSTRTVVFHAAIAERLGLNPSDHKCADLINNETGPITAGRLAEITGLSTGAITGVVDRLERAGFVSRQHDPEDRRRVVIAGSPERAPDMCHLFRPMMEGMARLCEKYTDEQLAFIVDFWRQCGEVSEAQIQALRELGPEPAVEPEKASQPTPKAATAARRERSGAGAGTTRKR